MMAFVARAETLQDLDRFLDVGLVDGDLLQAARERAVLLDVLVVLVRRRSHQPELSGCQDGLDQRGEVHGAAGRRAGADRRMDLVDEQDRHRPLAERGDDRLEAFLEVAAEAGAGQQGRGVERKHFGALEHLGDVVLQQARGEPLREGRLADAGVADEDGVVLAAPAQDLERALELRQAADERVQRAVPGARRQVDRICVERVAGRRAAPFTATGVGVAWRHVRIRVRGAAGRGRRDFADAVGDVLEDVESGYALRREELCRVRLGLLERGGEHIARLHFLAPGALDVQDRGLQHPAERHGLVGLFLLALLELLDVLVEVLVEIAAELRQIGAAGGEDPLAVGVVRERVEQVLQRQVRVMPRGGLAVRHGEDHLERGTEHAFIRVPLRRAAGSRCCARDRRRPPPWFPPLRRGTRRRAPGPGGAPPS